MDQEIINKVSKELDIDADVVDYAYKSYWKFIRETIQSLPLKNVILEEDFSKLKTNFNIPSLGKLVSTYDKLLKVRRRLNYIKELKNNAKN